MLQLIIPAIRAELERQHDEARDTRGTENLEALYLDEGAIAGAVMAVLPELTLVERLTAIADRMDGMVALRPGEKLHEISAWSVPPLSDGSVHFPAREARRALVACDTYFAASAQAWAQHPNGIPESVGETLEHLCDAAAEAVQKALGMQERRWPVGETMEQAMARPIEADGIRTLAPECSCGAATGEHKQDCNIYAWDPEERIEVSDPERSALRWLSKRGDGQGTKSATMKLETSGGVEFSTMIERGLVERWLEQAPDNPSRNYYRWRVTPLGLRAIEQEAL